MKRKYDYIALLERQGAIALSPTKKGIAESERCYTQMCKMLISDFLPPVAREDIAALSYAFYDIAVKYLNFGDSMRNDFDMLIRLSQRAAVSCVAKEKACRTLTAELEKKYSDCSKRVNEICEKSYAASNGKISETEKLRRACDSIGELVRLIRLCVLRNL